MRKDIVCPVIAGILGILGIGITIFPVVFGYNGSGMPNRCVFLLNELYAFFFIYLTVCLGSWVKEKHRLKRILENKLNKDYYGNCMLDRLVRLEVSLFQCKGCVFKDDVGIFMCSNRLEIFKRELI